MLENNNDPVKAGAGQVTDFRRSPTQASPQPLSNAATITMPTDPLVWLRQYTKTEDKHWLDIRCRLCGAPEKVRCPHKNPNKPFPDKPHFPPILDYLQREPILFIEKSRDMMLSWLVVGFFTHAAMTTEGIEVLLQSQKEDKAAELVEYAKTLYRYSHPDIRAACPLTTPLGQQSWLELSFANGSRIIGIPHGADQVRSYHPTKLLQDEAAYTPDAGESYAAAVPVCQQIVVLSSAGPGWFADCCESATDVKEMVRGLKEKCMPDGAPVLSVFYYADPERDPATPEGKQWMTAERKKYKSQQEWDKEQEIIHAAGGGERLFADILRRWAHKIILDPHQFELPPKWRRIGGADHGKANPTAFLEAAIDYDGNIYLCGEYYQPALSPDQHLDLLWEEWPELFRISEIYADPSIFYKTQAQAKGGFLAISELYAEERREGAQREGAQPRPGLQNLVPAPDDTEILGMERIQKHWHDLEHREPSLYILCPPALQEIQRPIYGVNREGCPNLLWELRRARREELSAAQLATKNPTEAIVDKDNHLRDCLKYIVLSLADPTVKTKEEQAAEAVKGLDPTSAMIRYQQFMEREDESLKPTPLGRRAWIQQRLRR